MLKITLYLSVTIMVMLSCNFTSMGQNNSKLINANQEYYSQYQMPVFGLTTEKEALKLENHLKNMDGILFAHVDKKTWYCTVITKGYITAENVIDILRVENCKTDDFTYKQMLKNEADETIKKYQSDLR